MFNCTSRRQTRVLMSKACKIEVGFCQATVKQQLRSRKGSPAAVEFLATTGTGERLPAESKEQRERRRRRNKAWRLDEEEMKGKEHWKEKRQMSWVKRTREKRIQEEDNK